ncbi:MAG: dihydroorotate dehydrogenase electron transfer subunit [Firmicutes bacterium]|nr:dihydroorotate dehydrogenase electron transfer subunit [Bacillota bacterium]
MTNMITHETEVLANEEVKPGFYHLYLSAPVLAEVATPGQFALLRCASDNVADPLLRRPLSFSNAFPERGEITFLYQVRGKGTKELSRLRAGHLVDVMGPLGTGFRLPDHRQPIAIIGCGVGVAPLIYLAHYGAQKGHEVYTFLGARSRDSLLYDPILVANSTDIVVATEDGSDGIKGNITALLKKYPHDLKMCGSAYICGPEAAMEAAASICNSFGVPCQVSLESIMACGVGACLGCTCTTTRHVNYTRVCTEGPVFDAQEVFFHG